MGGDDNFFATATAAEAGLDPTESLCTPATLAGGWLTLCYISVSLVLFRLSIDLIQTASQKTSKHFRESHHATTKKSTKPKPDNKSNNSNYGSISVDDTKKTKNENGKETQEEDKLLSGAEGNNNADNDDEEEALARHLLLDSASSSRSAVWSFRLQCILLIFLLVVSWLRSSGQSCLLGEGILRTCVIVLLLGVVLTYRDVDRERFGYVARFVYISTGVSLAIPIGVAYYQHPEYAISGDLVVVVIMVVYMLLALGESIFVPIQDSSSPTEDEGSKGLVLSTSAIGTLLKPYVWPDKTSDSAIMNRVRAIMTWVCVIASKACNLSSPVLVRKLQLLVILHAISITL